MQCKDPRYMNQLAQFGYQYKEWIPHWMDVVKNGNIAKVLYEQPIILPCISSNMCVWMD